MINKHKSHCVEVKKKDADSEEGDHSHAIYAGPGESDSDEESSERKTKSDDLFANTNMQEAMQRDKLNRDKLAEV